MKNLVALILSICILQFPIMGNAGVMLQGFYWDADTTPQNSWWMQLANSSASLSQAGFTALWIPPVLKSASGGYSRGYDPFDDYDIGSKDQRGTIPTRWGNRDELQRMVAQARANGLDVILDLNVSHRAGDSGDKKYFYKNAFGEDGKGRFQKGPMDFGNDFPFGRLFNFQSRYVIDGLTEAAEWLVKSLGTQGLRIDSAKELPAPYLNEILNRGELQKQYTVLEFWDQADRVNNYLRGGLNSRAAAFDFSLWSNLRDMAQAGGLYDMRRLVRQGLVAQSPELAVTFAENDDTDRGFPTQRNKHLSYAYILTSEGYPCVYWKDYFVYGMKDIISNLMWVHEALANGPTEYRWADDDLLAFERTGEPGVLVGMNDNVWQERSEWVQTHFGANVELHDYSGHQGSIWTDNQGRVKITVAPNSFVTYSRANIQFQFKPQSYRVTQEFFGAADLDIKPAQNNVPSKVGNIFVQGGTSLDWEITYEHNQWNNNSRLEMQIVGPDNRVVTRNAYGPSIGIARGSAVALQTGWYRLEIGASNAPAMNNFWWKQTYQAPKN